LLPERYTNLPPLKSSLLEQAVMLLDTHMRCNLGLTQADMQGAAGFNLLLAATMQAVAGPAYSVAIGGRPLAEVAGVMESLQQAGVDGEWRSVAQRLCKYKVEHGCWPGCSASSKTPAE
jgi:hypothetical protein